MTGPADDLERAGGLYRAGEYESAKSICQHLLAHDPNDLKAINLLGGILIVQGAHEEAIETLRKGHETEPGNAMISRNLATILFRLRRYGEALTVANTLAHPDADDARLITNLAIASHHVDRPLAGMLLVRAIAAQGNAVTASIKEWLSARGRAQTDADLATLEFLYETCPSIREIGLFMMEAQRVRQQPDEALSTSNAILEQHPDFFEAHFNRGLLLYSLRRFVEAARAFRRAADLRPDSLGALARAAYSWTRCASWEEAENAAAVLQERIVLAQKKGVPLDLSPYTAVALNLPPDLQLAVASDRASIIEASNPQISIPADSGPQPAKRPLRIAYLSADFHNHATAHLICDLFACHNRKEVHVTGYSYGPDVDDEYRKRIVTGCDEFVDLRALDDFESARRIVDDRIDIAIDLKGYTFGARPGILARRPAPIQVAYLGFPGTMGANFIDYMISDRIVSPPNEASFYSEKIVFMPDCYQINAANQAIDRAPLNRAQAGLPDQAFVFCCFNRANKIDRQSFARWMAILDAVPDSVLWLYGAHREANESLANAAKAAGLASKRLIFAPALKKAEHLARLALADLFLDTRHISAHTTASDCLWAGVPLLAIPGNSFIGRVSASLLTAMKLEDMIADDDRQYVSKAIALARDSAALKALRARVAQAKIESSLFRPDHFARGLEFAYREMWNIYAKGENPTNIDVISER